MNSEQWAVGGEQWAVSREQEALRTTCGNGWLIWRQKADSSKR
jgi:hypothetical protein